MSDKAMLVLGEAPESDDEEFQHAENSRSGIAESDNAEFEADSNYRTSNSNKGFIENRKRQVGRESFAGHSDNFKMSEDTLLHRKLSKENMQFYSNLTTLNKEMYFRRRLNFQIKFLRNFKYSSYYKHDLKIRE
ncbi:uncharacterized protein LOC132927382 [Rhopalosiphum padi]|uniref:uncharacterized protein LOC132927382 n=1 Tax=Rhopalosiphum padi TaxID=40932 RepID=UPI00298DB389|nr:uncharacterized protein LOC132927382 [Rhopalosiphum padi]